MFKMSVIESGKEMAAGFNEEVKGGGEEELFYRVEFKLTLVIHVFVICTCILFWGEVFYFTESSGFLKLCVICEKPKIYGLVNNDVRERCGVQNKENGPQYQALRLTICKL